VVATKPQPNPLGFFFYPHSPLPRQFTLPNRQDITCPQKRGAPQKSKNATYPQNEATSQPANKNEVEAGNRNIAKTPYIQSHQTPQHQKNRNFTTQPAPPKKIAINRKNKKRHA
jgi:hypothetical protein